MAREEAWHIPPLEALSLSQTYQALSRASFPSGNVLLSQDEYYTLWVEEDQKAAAMDCTRYLIDEVIC